MDELNKGTITVIVATIVTSGMILLTGNSIADNTEKKEKQIEVSTDNTTEHSIQQLTTGIVATDSETQDTPKRQVDIPLPPPGPFTQLGQDSSKEIYKSKALIAPIAPKAPVAKSNKSLVPPAKPEKLPFAPEMKSLQANKPATPSTSADVKGSNQTVSAPVMKKSAPKTPSMPDKPGLRTPELTEITITTPTNTIQAPVQSSALAMPPKAPKSLPQPQAILNNNKPIWMQQNQALINSGNQPKIGGGSNLGTIPQGQNPPGVNFVQQYRYIPVPIYPGYNNQKMPMNNGGYYFAPIPKYWMPNMMPTPDYMQQKPTQTTNPSSNSEGSN